MLATVNALSFPLYVVPFGAVFAKLGEYMNQCPIYVSGRDFHLADVVLSLTYAAEYALVLLTCRELLDSAEQGYPTGDADDDQVFLVAVCWLCLTLIRAAATGVRDFSSRSPSQETQCLEKQGTGSLSCQSNKGQPEKLRKLGTGSVGIVSCQSSKADLEEQDSVSCQLNKVGDPSQDVKEVEPNTNEV
jgi:hypothetical protein